MTQPTQLPKRPPMYHPDNWPDGVYDPREADALFDSQDAKIAELEKSVQVHNDSAVEAWRLARKWQKNLFELEQSCRELEKELRVTRRALEMACACKGFEYQAKAVNFYLEAARKETK